MTQKKYYLSEVDRDKPALKRYPAHGTNDKGAIIKKEMSREERLRALALVEFVLFLHNLRKNNSLNSSDYGKHKQLLLDVLSDLKIGDNCFKEEVGVNQNQQKTLLAIRCGLQISVHRNPIMVIFEDMAEFIGDTKLGPILSFGILLAGVTTFIVLTQRYDMGAIGGYTFLASVFGTFFIDMGASQVYKHYGLFKDKPAHYTVSDPNDAGIDFQQVPGNL